MSDPTPIGVFRAVERPVHGQASQQEIETARETIGPGELEALLHAGSTWTVNWHEAYRQRDSNPCYRRERAFKGSGSVPQCPGFAGKTPIAVDAESGPTYMGCTS